jgi:hypothetical protein
MLAPGYATDKIIACVCMCDRCSGAAMDLLNAHDRTPGQVAGKLLGGSWWGAVTDVARSMQLATETPAAALVPARAMLSAASPVNAGGASATPANHVGGIKRKASNSGDSEQTGAPHTLDQHTEKRPRYTPAS